MVAAVEQTPVQINASIPLGPTQERFIICPAREVCIGGSRREGKALPLDTPILTPSGWEKIGDISVGDRIMAQDGTETYVLAVFPQPVQDLWRFHFSDGTSAVSTDDHLWAVETIWDRHGGVEADTRERSRGIFSAVGMLKNKATRRALARKTPYKIVRASELREALTDGRWASGGRWSLPLSQSMQFKKRETKIHPYILGTLLGDGCISQKEVYFTNDDEEVLENIRLLLPLDMHLTRMKSAKYGYSLSRKIPKGRNPIYVELESQSLAGTNSHSKFIPNEYLWNDAESRLALLQGLMDTDGWVSKHANSALFASTSIQLIQGMEFLVRSLGGVARRQKKVKVGYRLTISLPNGMCPFRTSRKARYITDKKMWIPRRFITACEYEGNGESVCIEIDNPSGLFVINDFIVTHNSFSGYSAMISHALRQDPSKWPIPWVVCRDTATNLHRTTVPGAYKWEQQCKQAMCLQIGQHAADGRVTAEAANSIIQSLRASPWVRLTKRSNTEVMWLRTGQLDADGRVVWPVMAYLFGMDQLKDISRFQSMELGGGWFEEPAPAAEDDIGGGIQEVAWIVMLSSLNYEVDAPRAQITMNPPDEDHWTWRRFVADNEDPDNRVYLHIPVGENKHLPQWYREHIDKALKARPDLHRRLVQGLPGFIQKGKPVASNFSEDLHVSKVPLTFNKFAKEMYLGWDFGFNPTAIGMQQTTTGHFHFLFAFTGENMGVRQFIDYILKPYMSTHVPSATLWHIGDPQGNVGSDTDIMATPVREIIDKLGGYWRSGPQKWDPRREAVHNSLAAIHMGKPLVQIDKANCGILIKALRGAWHYQQVGQGRVSEVPKKDFASHQGDAYSYLMAVLMGERGIVRKDLRVRSASYSKGTPREKISAGMVRA